MAGQPSSGVLLIIHDSTGGEGERSDYADLLREVGAEAQVEVQTAPDVQSASAAPARVRLVLVIGRDNAPAGDVQDSMIPAARRRYPRAFLLAGVPAITRGGAEADAQLEAAIHAGADDTLALPASPAVLNARVRAGLKAASSPERAAIESSISDLYASVLNTVDVAVIMVDDQTHVTYWNMGAERIFGMPQTEALGKHLHNVYETEWTYPEQRLASLQQVMETGFWQGDVPIRIHMGQYAGRQVAVSAHVQRVEHNGRFLLAAMLHDRTAQHRAEMALRETEAMLREQNRNTSSILQAIPQAVVVFNAVGEISMWNAAAETLFGQSLALERERIEKSGHTFSIRQCPQFQWLASRAFSGETLLDVEVTFVDEDSVAHLLSISTAAHYGADEHTQGLVAVISDMTERHRIAIAEREQRMMAQALQDVTATLTRTLDLQSVMIKIMQTVGRLVRHDAVNIMLLQDDQLHIAYHQGYAASQTEYLNKLRFSLQDYPFRVIKAQSTAYVIPDVMLDTQWKQDPVVGWPRAYLGAPIQAYGRVIGFLNLDSTAPNAFSEQDAARLQAFADQTAIALENAQLYEAVNRDAQELRALNRATSFLFTQHLFTSSDLKGVSQAIVTAITHEFMQVDCSVYLLSSLASADQVRDGLIRTALIAADTGETNPPMLTRAELEMWVGDMADFDSLVTNRRRPQVQSWLVLPLRTLQGVIGAIELSSTEARMFDREDDIRVLMAFAERAAAALYSLQLHQELQQRVEARTAELQQMKNRAEAILHHSSDAILLIGHDSTIQQVNRAFRMHFGMESHEVIGKSIEVLAEYAFHEALMRAFLDTLLQRVPARLEIEGRRKDGTRFNADVIMSPVLETGKPVTSIVCGIRDISERKRMEDDLRAAFLKERELNELRAEFVARASHEFRTPLSVISTATDMLQHYWARMDDELRKEKFANIRVQVEGVTRLLDEMLSISRTDSATMNNFNPLPLDLPSLVEQCVRQVGRTEGRTHHLEFSLPDSAAKKDDSGVIHPPSPTFFGDEKMLRRVFHHLLMNAVRYSAAGSHIRIHIEPDEVGFLVRVQDEGIGIPKAEQQRLFNPFYRAANVAHLPGSGLGLAVAQQIVALHRGTISIHSVEQEGTSVLVHLPYWREHGLPPALPTDMPVEPVRAHASSSQPSQPSQPSQYLTEASVRVYGQHEVESSETTHSAALSVFPPVFPSVYPEQTS